MLTANSVGRVGLRAATTLALAVSLAACAGEPASPEESVADTTRPVMSDAAVVGDPAACTRVDAPMLDIPGASDTEPQMRIPQPPGWERSSELDNVDEVLRFALANTDLGAYEHPQNVVVVGLEPAPDADAQAIFDNLRVELVKMLDAKNLTTDLTTTAGTVCGLPTQTITYAGTAMGLGAMNAPQGRPATILNVVTKSGGHTYLVTLMTTTEPDNPKYQRDAETILRGFQVLPPAAAKL